MGFESIDIFLLLIAAAFLAGFVDSIAGGGGLITVPVLLLAGLPPIQALATNKLQGLFGAATAALVYARKGHVDLKKQVGSALIAAGAGAMGAFLVTRLPNENMRLVLPYLLIAIALFFWLKPGLSDIDKTRRISATAFALTVVPLIGFYDGFFGPGTGSFFMIGFVLLSGYGVLKATAHTKLLNFTSNFGGFLVFALTGSVVWKLGLAMGVAQITGAQLGAHLAMKNGARLIKPLLTVTCLALAIKLLFDA